MEGGGYRRRSKIWLAFIPEGKGQDERAICRICNESFPPNIEEQVEKCTTAKLWRHLGSEHPEVAKMLAGINQDDIVKEGVMENLNLSFMQKQTSKGFTSKVWKFFYLDDYDKNISICFECGDRVSRGCDRNTTSMWNHIKQNHPSQYASAQKEEQDEEDSSPLALEKAAVKDQFLLYSTRQNSYICKTCGTIMRLESPDEETNTSRLMKHLDNIYHKRVQHGLEPPKRPILPKYYANTRKAENKKIQEKRAESKKTLPAPTQVEKLVGGREVDFIHSAMIMQTMYEQQKRDMCCDYTIILPHKQEREDFEKSPIAGTETGTVECYESKAGFEYKVHASVMAVVSDKMRAILDNSGITTIMMHDISRASMKLFIEIAYLGKLKNLVALDDVELLDLYATAQSFGATSIIQYLERSCPLKSGKSLFDKAANPQNGKVSIVFKREQDEETLQPISKPKSSVKKLTPTSASSTDYKETVNPAVGRKSSSSRRKRPPLSTTFRLKVPKTNECIASDSDDCQAGNNRQSYNGSDEGSPMELGMKFEIQGDTAILRASDEGIDSNIDFGHNT